VCDALIDAGADINRVMGSREPFFSHPNGIDFDMPALGCAVDLHQWGLASHLLARGATPSFGVMGTDIALTLAKFAPVSLVEQMYQAGYSIVMDHEFRMLFAPPVGIQLRQCDPKWCSGLQSTRTQKSCPGSRGRYAHAFEYPGREP
jgi:hypothetical protein